MLGGGNFEEDGINLTSRSLDKKTVEISREQIESGKVYFLPVTTSIGNSIDFAFDVKDDELRSVDPGVFTFDITGAPKSADETIKDLQFAAEFEASIGQNRYESIKRAIQHSNLTNAEALTIISEQQSLITEAKQFEELTKYLVPEHQLADIGDWQSLDGDQKQAILSGENNLEVVISTIEKLASSIKNLVGLNRFEIGWINGVDDKAIQPIFQNRRFRKSFFEDCSR